MTPRRYVASDCPNRVAKHIGVHRSTGHQAQFFRQLAFRDTTFKSDNARCLIKCENGTSRLARC